MLSETGCYIIIQELGTSSPATFSEADGLTIITGAYALDGGTIQLFVEDNKGYTYTVTLSQRKFLEDDMLTYKPGRLYINNSLIAVRSLSEEKILTLLSTAVFYQGIQRELPGNYRSTQRGLVLSKDIKEVIEQSEYENMQMWVKQIIEYVRSNMYVELAQRRQHEHE